MSGIINAESNIALGLAEAASKVNQLLSPSGAIGSAVGDILDAASDVALIEETAIAALSNVQSFINDPIQVSFSNGQPYSGAFITAPTAQLMPMTLSPLTLAASTLALAALTCEEIAALAARVGFAILTDVDLALALAAQFEDLISILKSGFSINLLLECLCGCEDVESYSYPTLDNTQYYYIPACTTFIQDPNALTSFVSTISSSFPNTPGISGIATSVWVEGLGVACNADGTPIAGIPSDIDAGTYNDIANSLLGLAPSTTIATTVDYSHQQNLLNVTVALAIDNGLATIFTNLMTNGMVTLATTQVILNRLGSTAARGDTTMFLAMVTALGPANAPPDILALLAALIAGAKASNATNTNSTAPQKFYAGGVLITTNTNTQTVTQIVDNINAILTLLGLTIQQVFNQSTCNSIICSSSLWNVHAIQAVSGPVMEALIDPVTVKMAKMFSLAA